MLMHVKCIPSKTSGFCKGPGHVRSHNGARCNVNFHLCVVLSMERRSCLVGLGAHRARACIDIAYFVIMMPMCRPVCTTAFTNGWGNMSKRMWKFHRVDDGFGELGLGNHNDMP